jgi:hypothetical protein
VTVRQPAGIPAGGQFAATAHAEPGVSLAGPQPRNGMPALGSAAAGYTDRFDDAGNLILQVRLENGRPNDAPDGTPAIIRYSTDPQGPTCGTHFTDGVMHDGSGDKPSVLFTWPSGRTEIRRGHFRPLTDFFFKQDSPDGQPASVKTSAEGTVITGHYAQGILQDPSPRIPARVEVRTDGTRIEQHSPFGQLEDLPDGTPSEHHYGPAGNLTAELRRHGGNGWDSDYGDPSERRYRKDGTIYKEVYRYNGSLLDSPTGKPALIEYAEDGSIARQVSEPTQWDSYMGKEVRFNARMTRRQASPHTRKEPVPRHVPKPPEVRDRQRPVEGFTA